MSDLQKRIADALYQAALEGDESPKMLLSQRVVEILLIGSPPPAITAALDYDDKSLKERLCGHRVNQSELARRLGIEASTVNRMIKGTRSIKLGEMPTIIAYLGEVEAFTPEPVEDEDLLRAKVMAGGVVQTELARRLGLHPSAINKMLKGHRRIKVNEAVVIRQMLSEAAQ